MKSYLQCTPPLNKMSFIRGTLAKSTKVTQTKCSTSVSTAFRLIFKQGRLKGAKGKDIRFIPTLLGRITSLIMPVALSNALVFHHGPFERRKTQRNTHNISTLCIHNSIISSNFMPYFLHFVSEPIPNSFVFIIVIVATVTIAVAIPILTSAVLRGDSRL